jgi:gluconate 2-dehydrogenase gamma chain
MPSNPVSRRDVLRTLAMGAVGGSVLQAIPLQAAEQVHWMVKQEKTLAPAGKYRPKFFPAHQYSTLGALCDAIIPPDEHSGGAVQAGAPEFIDLLTSESKDYQLTLGGGLMWLDSLCTDRYENPYLTCSMTQRRQILDLIAYRKNSETDVALSQGVEFFAFLRKLTTDAFYSSEIGIKDLRYMGNTYVTTFPGCPPVPET